MARRKSALNVGKEAMYPVTFYVEGRVELKISFELNRILLLEIWVKRDRELFRFDHDTPHYSSYRILGCQVPPLFSALTLVQRFARFEFV